LKNFALISVLWLSALLLQAQEKVVTYSGAFTGAPFDTLASDIETTLGIHVFYNPSWTGDIMVSGRWHDDTPLKVIEAVVSPRGLFCMEDEDGNIIITKNYTVKRSFLPDDGDSTVMAIADTAITYTASLLEGEVITLGNPANLGLGGNVLLSGFITNSATGEPLQGASVMIAELEKGVITNQDGYYLVSLPRGSYRVEYRSLGSHDTFRNVNLYSGGRINISMEERIIPIREAIVTASRREKLERLESGMARMNIMTIRLSPSSLGEADLIKSVLMMPGVQSVGEGSAGFNVRGGSADQNLILLYGSPVYNSSHFFGFFSAVNSEVINDVALYKGGIPAQYGGRVSSIMDITGKDGNKKEFSGNAGVSMVAAHLTLEGPLEKEQSSFLLAARGTYSNWVLHRLPDASVRNSKAGFYDINGHIVTDIGKNGLLELSAYYSHDDFRFNSDTTYAYDNLITSARYRYSISPTLLALFTLGNSHYRYNVSNSRIPDYAASMEHMVNTTSAVAGFTLYLPSGNELKFGGETSLHIIDPGTRTPTSPLSVVKPLKIDREAGVETALYADYKADLGARLTARGGIRLSSFLVLGPGTVNRYNPLYPKEPETVTDSVKYRPGSIIRAYASPELRLSLNYLLTGETSLKLNYNRTGQYLHLLTNTTSISPTDTWKMSDYHIKPQKGDQLAGGLYFDIAGNDYEISLDGYYKWLHNLIDYKGGARLNMNENIEQDLIPAEGRSWGIEFMLRKNRGKLKSTLNYTWSNVRLRSISQFSSETVNGGAFYPAGYDRPHDLSLQFNWMWSRRVNLSSNVVYSTGRPVTYPVTWYDHDGIPVIYYSERNSYRLPDYFRWDLSMNIYGSLKAARFFRSTWNISIYNVTGRENIYSVFFRIENGKIQGYRLSVFGRAIPTVSYRIDF
jgi:hypothetical protein